MPTNISTNNAEIKNESMETDLIISGINFPKFSARNCQQTLSLISAEHNNIVRSLNGKLLYLGSITKTNDKEATDNNKYKSIITCSDKNTPSIMDLKKGDTVNVACIQMLSQTFAIDENSESDDEYYLLKLNKKPRPAPICIEDINDFAFNEKKNCIKIKKDIINSLKEKQIIIQYQPIMDMMVTDINIKTTEWEIKNTWSITLEEV